MKTGLQYIEGHTYFFNDDGYMQTGKVSNPEKCWNWSSQNMKNLITDPYNTPKTKCSGSGIFIATLPILMRAHRFRYIRQ